MREFGGTVLVSYEEAVALGIECAEQPPAEPERCNFCRRPKEYKGLIWDGKVRLFTAMPCTCAEARQFKDLRDREENEVLIREGMKEHELELARTRDTGVPPRFQQATFQRFDVNCDAQHRAKDYAFRYAEKFEQLRNAGKNSLFFFGECGCGKTHLACAIVLRLNERRIPCRFCTFEQVLQECRDSFKDGEESEKTIRDGYKKTPFLVLDDLTKEKPTEYSLSVLYDLVNYRYAYNLPMVVTANHGREGLAKQLTPKDGDKTAAEAIVSRLYQMSVPINMAGIKDYRRL